MEILDFIDIFVFDVSQTADLVLDAFTGLPLLFKGFIFLGIFMIGFLAMLRLVLGLL